MPELVKEQQIILLLESCGLGVFLGVLFDIFSVPVRMCRRQRLTVFFLDVIFLIISSLITFYFSLAVMDGRLHPLLFGGCLFGFVLQHVTVGRFIGFAMYRIALFFRAVFAWLIWGISLLFSLLLNRLQRVCRLVFIRRPKKLRKSRKKVAFFKKKP